MSGERGNQSPEAPAGQHREEIVMQITDILIFALVGLCSINSTVLSQELNRTITGTTLARVS
jgi:hypothetical protein